MTTVIFTTKSRVYRQIESSGHSGFAKEGEDIICSAVSALLINCANSLEAFTDDAFETETEDGYLRITFLRTPSKEARLLVDSLLLGLRSIEETCNGEFLQVVCRDQNLSD